MKSANIAELKAHLSRYVKLVKRGERVRVMERNTPVAELIPYQPSPQEVFAQFASEGRCKLGTQQWSSFKVTPLKKPISAAELEAVVRAIEGDP